jgi:hypothetical protein
MDQIGSVSRATSTRPTPSNADNLFGKNKWRQLHEADPCSRRKDASNAHMHIGDSPTRPAGPAATITKRGIAPLDLFSYLVPHTPQAGTLIFGK